jgi:hypothetical protein
LVGVGVLGAAPGTNPEPHPLGGGGPAGGAAPTTIKGLVAGYESSLKVPP